MGLKTYILKRVAMLIPVMLGVTVITFLLSHVIPSNPSWVWAGSMHATEETIQNVIERYHLNEPLYVQYLYYLSDLLRGDLGTSPVTNRPVLDDLRQYFPNTIELSVSSLIFSILVGIPLGVVSATRKDKLPDHVSRLFSLCGVSMPIFWLGLLLQMVFYYELRWIPDPGGRISEEILVKFPVAHITGLKLLDSVLTGNWPALLNLSVHIIMPMICLSYSCIALISRMTRSAMLEVMRADYIRTARSTGFSERVIIYKHALRNALIPATTVIGFTVGWLLAGSVVTESVFYWPGIGQYAVNAAFRFDFPSIMGFTVFVALFYALASLVVDITYAYLDPRIRYE